MTISQWVLVGVAVALGGLWLSRSRQRRGRLDPHFLPAHLYGSERRLSFSQLLVNVVLVLVVLGLVWLLLNAQFSGVTVRFTL